MKKHLLHAALLMMLLSGCNNSGDKKPYETDAFKTYWYSGKAEIDSYNLIQSRYGEDRKGKAVLIFVSEDFSKKKHVKLDDPAAAERDKVTVLKLNFTKTFITGIYPYSMMQSVFTPVDREEFPNTLKTTMSTQEWCGQVFTQLNLKPKGFDVKSYSYFEEEGDESFMMKKMLLEDEVWNIIRLDPSALPVGEVEVIPALFFTRLKHTDLKALQATATRTERGSEVTYALAYTEPERTISITFEKTFPHKILRWEESFNEQGTVRRTTATLDRTLNIDYWTKNKNEFSYLRDSLNLNTY